MFIELLYIFLISLSPFGEARAGIPYGIINGIPVFQVFLIGWISNLFVFPLFYKGIALSNKYLWRYRFYKIFAVYLSKKTKKQTKKSIEKYGVWGLMVFVMIPLPITGAYTGTLAAYILGLNYKKSFYFISAGITISSIIIAAAVYVGYSYS